MIIERVICVGCRGVYSFVVFFVKWSGYYSDIWQTWLDSLACNYSIIGKSIAKRSNSLYRKRFVEFENRTCYSLRFSIVTISEQCRWRVSDSGVSEHLRICPITLRPSSSQVMPSILSHLNSTGRSAYFDNFKIVSSCSGTCEFIIHENHVNSKLKPSLNIQGTSIPLNLL